MHYQDASENLARYRQQIAELRGKMREVQESIEPQEIKDYEFSTLGGRVRLSELFGDKEYLFVIHNMGASCPYCTLWADGFNGITDHLQNRAAFVVSSPDVPDKQQKFKESRGWRFPMVSHRGSTFASDMGYKSKDGWEPGVSVFRKPGAKILRVSDTSFGPGDDFCSVWHFFNLIPEGSAGWQPQYKY
ncbi:MAG: DUF899 domain-containing protein [Gammaproteobacteria bacterium]|nr:DUF899 domain-containing protein [Gammaproteobacteria bacterium]